MRCLLVVAYRHTMASRPMQVRAWRAEAVCRGWVCGAGESWGITRSCRGACGIEFVIYVRRVNTALLCYVLCLIEASRRMSGRSAWQVLRREPSPYYRYRGQFITHLFFSLCRLW